MRIEKYTDKDLSFAYDDMKIKFFKEGDSENFGKIMLQELVFFKDCILYHLSDDQEESPPEYPCLCLWYNDIVSYDFDFDNEVLSMEFILRPTLRVYASPSELDRIYKNITTLDENFMLTDFDEVNKAINNFFV